jgi:hypothetical protein
LGTTIPVGLKLGTGSAVPKLGSTTTQPAQPMKFMQPMKPPGSWSEKPPSI